MTAFMKNVLIEFSDDVFILRKLKKKQTQV